MVHPLLKQIRDSCLLGTLPSNLEFNKTACEQAILSVRLERSKKKQQLREEEGEERSSDLVQSFGDIVHLVPDGRPSSRMKLYAYLPTQNIGTQSVQELFFW